MRTRTIAAAAPGRNTRGFAMIQRLPRLGCVSPLWLAAMLLAPSAGAQTSSSGEAASSLEEVMVTATRRVERLQDVPVSVSAFSQEQMDAQGLRNIDDLTRLTPGVTF